MNKQPIHRNTAQRQLILDVVLNSLDHPTAEEVYIRARKEAAHISLGTVYRNLAFLSESGQIRKLSSPDGPDHYDFNLESHYHFLCQNCGEMCDIPLSCSPKEQAVMAPKEAGFDIRGYSLVYVGLCPNCSKKISKIGESENEN